MLLKSYSLSLWTSSLTIRTLSLSNVFLLVSEVISTDYEDLILALNVFLLVSEVIITDYEDHILAFKVLFLVSVDIITDY